MDMDKRAVFCDFDGTITAVETFVGMLKTLIPDRTAEIMPRLYRRELTLRQGVRYLLEAIPSDRYPEVIAYARAQAIRPGLGAFLDFLEDRQVPFVIISGGIEDMIEAVLQQPGTGGRPLRRQVKAIAALHIATDRPHLGVTSPQEGEEELVDKVALMHRYPAQERIAIGDSVTDIRMALAADLVFARDRLRDYLRQAGKSFIEWDNFGDIQAHLHHHWHRPTS